MSAQQSSSAKKSQSPGDKSRKNSPPSLAPPPTSGSGSVKRPRTASSISPTPSRPGSTPPTSANRPLRALAPSSTPNPALVPNPTIMTPYSSAFDRNTDESQRTLRWGHGPTSLPPRTYRTSESPWRPQRRKDYSTEIASDKLGDLEERMSKVEIAMEGYIGQRRREAVDRSKVQGLEDVEEEGSTRRRY